MNGSRTDASYQSTMSLMTLSNGSSPAGFVSSAHSPATVQLGDAFRGPDTPPGVGWVRSARSVRASMQSVDMGGPSAVRSSDQLECHNPSGRSVGRQFYSNTQYLQSDRTTYFFSNCFIFYYNILYHSMLYNII